MRTTKRIITCSRIATILLLALCSCEREDTICFKADIEPLLKSKVHIDTYSDTEGTYSIDIWDGSDKLLVNGDTCEVSIQGNEYIVSGVTSSDNGYYAAYPISFARGINSTGISSIYLPEIQEFTWDNYQRVEMPLVAYTANNRDNLHFYNAAALMKISVKNDISAQPFVVRKIEIMSSNALLSGTGSITDANSNNPTITLTSGSKRILLNCNDPVSINNGDSAAFYIVIPPFNVSNNKITINIEGSTDSAHHYMFSRTQEDNYALNSISMAMLITVPTIAINANSPFVKRKAFLGDGTRDFPYQITYPGAWDSLARRVNAGESFSGEYFELTRDLTLRQNVIPVGTNANPFKGIFNGQEHTITINGFSVASRTGLFGYIDSPAKISKIILNGNVTISGNIIYYGGLCAHARSSTIEDCDVNISADIKSTYSYPTMGCIIGKINGVTANRLTNYGSLIAKPNSPAQICYIGGICGDGTDAKIKNSANIGTIEMKATIESYIGGIIGSMDGSTQSFVNNCYNQGLLKTNCSRTDIGGICGKSNRIIENCYNNGTLTGVNGSRKFGILGGEGTSQACYIGSNCGTSIIVGTSGTAIGCTTFDPSTGVLTNNVTVNNIQCSTLSNALKAWVSAYSEYLNWSNDALPTHIH